MCHRFEHRPKLHCDSLPPYMTVRHCCLVLVMLTVPLLQQMLLQRGFVPKYCMTTTRLAKDSSGLPLGKR